MSNSTAMQTRRLVLGSGALGAVLGWRVWFPNRPQRPPTFYGDGGEVTFPVYVPLLPPWVYVAAMLVGALITAGLAAAILRVRS